MSSIRFRAIIEILGINPYVRVDAARATRLQPGWRKPVPVRVQVDGQPQPAWRINMMPAGDGDFYLYLHDQVRRASASAVGDEVEVELVFDSDYRKGPAHPVPAWFAAGLEQDAGAQAGWRALSPSRQKEILRYFAGLKSSAAQQRNLTQVLHVLAGGAARFMARDWSEGR